MADSRLDGRSILILEDEYLIAMDVEQTCIECGARQVTIVRSLDQLRDQPLDSLEFDAAIIDLRLGGETTTHFAHELTRRRIPFVFATGLNDTAELSEEFPGVPVIGKPYSGEELVRILAGVIQTSRSRCSA